MITLPNGRKIGPGQPCFLVAEIGQNHNGDVYTALRLAGEAAKAGFDAVKLCKRHLPGEMTLAMANEPYSGPQSFGPTYGRHREFLELPIADYKHLQERIRYNGWDLALFATACHPVSVDELEREIDPPLYKVASRDLDNLPLIERIARTGKPIVLSMGMARGPEEIGAALNTILPHHDQIVLCYCVSKYPTPDEDTFLGALADLREMFGVLVGFSDHSVGIHLAQAAAVLGAVYIEKHVTLARAMKGSDHAASLEQAGMEKLVRNIRSVERSMRGQLWGALSREVQRNRRRLGRSIVSARMIRAGETITEDMLCLKSPGDGIPWAKREKLLGQKARRIVPADMTLVWEDVMAPERIMGI